MPDDPIPATGWAAVVATVAAILAWFKGGDRARRIERRDAMKEWQHLYDQLNCRFTEQQQRSDENHKSIATLNARVDDCEAKHAECQKQHEECEEKHAAVCERLATLEEKVR